MDKFHLPIRINQIVYLLLFFCYLVLGYFAYLLLYTPVYFETDQPFKLEKKEYRIGETLTYTSKYCKYREYIPLRVTRNLVDGYVYPLPSQSESSASLSNFPIGCKEIQVDVPLQVPMRVLTGKANEYHIEIVIDYQINPLKTETKKFVTEKFTLLPALPMK